MYTVSLEYESGKAAEQLADDGVIDRVLKRHLGERPLLQYLDPYGDTVFNRLQMPQVLEELSSLVSATNDDAERETLEAIQRLARQCSGEHHLYLKFYGD